jgi:translation initiation factor 2B subunit (eIF-2B alpha/beta/delta family)
MDNNTIPEWLQAASFWTEQVRAIKENKTDGSVMLAGTAMKALQELVTNLEKKEGVSQAEKSAITKQACRELVDLRPNMIVLANTAALFCDMLQEALSQNQPITDTLHSAEKKVYAPSKQAATHLAAFLRQTNPQNILTLSNSTTILHGLKILAEKVEKSALPRIIVMESRPQCEGVKFAEAAAQTGFAVDLISDAQVALFARQADCALSGIDTLYPSGDFINRTGTFVLGLAAQRFKIPFYVVGDSLKLAENPTELAVLEENDPAELASAWHIPIKELPTLIKTHNYYFERVPADLVTGYILEDGLIEPEILKSNVVVVSQRLKKLLF